METKVTLFELLISSGGFILALVSSWIHMKINVASLKTEMEYIKKELEQEKADNKTNYNSLTEKIDGIFKVLTEIKVSIAKKN
jgi:hypothetical protein